MNNDKANASVDHLRWHRESFRSVRTVEREAWKEENGKPHQMKSMTGTPHSAPVRIKCTIESKEEKSQMNQLFVTEEEEEKKFFRSFARLS